MSTEFNGILPIDYSGNSQLIKTRSVYQYDHGLYLLIKGITNPNEIQGHFATRALKTAVNVQPQETEDGVKICVPDTLLTSDDDIFVYLYIENGILGYTARTIQIPVIPRAKPKTITIEDPNFIVINQLAQELQELVGTAEKAIQSASDAADDADAAATNADEKASAANAAAINATNAIAGLDDKVDASVEERIATITDGLADGSDYAAEVVSARTDENGVTHTSLKTRINEGLTQLSESISGLGLSVVDGTLCVTYEEE